MRTIKPIASISWCPCEWLRGKLQSMIDCGIICDYMLIEHKPEADSLKPHIHFWLMPASRVDTERLRKELTVGDIRPLPFTVSKGSDWLLYAMHYPPYLVSKGIERIYHYEISAVVSSSEDLRQYLFQDGCDSINTVRFNTFKDMCRQGKSWEECIQSGIVPPSQVIFYEKLWHSFRPFG